MLLCNLLVLFSHFIDLISCFCWGVCVCVCVSARILTDLNFPFLDNQYLICNCYFVGDLLRRGEKVQQRYYYGPYS